MTDQADVRLICKLEGDWRLVSYQALYFPFRAKEAKTLRLRVNVKFERGPTFTFTRDLPYIIYILFTRVRTLKLRDSAFSSAEPVVSWSRYKLSRVAQGTRKATVEINLLVSTRQKPRTRNTSEIQINNAKFFTPDTWIWNKSIPFRSRVQRFWIRNLNVRTNILEFTDVRKPVADPDLQISGGPGHPNPETSSGRGGRSQNVFSALQASVWSKNKRRPPPGPLPWIRLCEPLWIRLPVM